VAFGLIGGRYELIELLGAGGMGKVYRALDRLAGEAVALKSVKRQGGSPSRSSVPGPCESVHERTRTLETRLTRAPFPAPNTLSSGLDLALASEFRVLSALRHPNIVGVLDYGFDHEKVPYFTMTLLPSATTVVEASRHRPLESKLDLLFQMLEALSYLHRHGIVHRDLKPSNVLVTGDRLTVLDFGLSGLRTGVRMGTYGYMAPETLGSGTPSALSDLYAVGVIAFETITGIQPFAGRRRGESPDVSLLSDYGKLGAVVEQLLSPDPSRRPASAHCAIEALAGAAGIAIPPERVGHRESYLRAAPLIGRRRELAQLEEALRDAIDGSGSAWLVGGESGVGKSRVLAELRSAALVQGAIVLSGQGGSGIPYSMFRDPVLRLALMSEVPAGDASVLKAAFPDIERILGREIPDAPIDPQTFPDRLARAVLGLVRRCPSAIVMELEDCHLIGESLYLLNALVRRASRLPLLIVASYRDNERPRLPQELPGVNVIRLMRFNESGIRDMMSAMLGPELGASHALVQYLARETEGNAFFLVEAVRTLAEGCGRLDRISPETLPANLFARGLMDAISRRLESLPEWTAHPLRIAAVLGRDVDVPAIGAACPDCNLDRFLLECSDAGILEGHGYQWRFTHDKLREGLIAKIGSEADRSIYAESAAAIENLYGESPAWINIQARCWKQAGVAEKAVHYLLLASGQCLQAGAPVRAVDLGLDAVVQLGVEIPGEVASQGQAVGAELERIVGLLAGRAPADLMQLPLLADPRVGRIIEILVQLAPGAHINQRLELFALAVVKCMALTLEYGVGPCASFVFGTYALVLRNLTGDSRLAYDFGRLAVDTDIRLRGRGGAAALFVHYWFLNHWIHPIETNLEPTLESAAVGFEEQNILYACFSAAAYVIYLNASGCRLDRVVEAADVQLARIGGRVHVAVFQAVQERQIAQALAGRTAGPLSFSDATYHEERDLAYIVATPNYSQTAYYYRSKMQIHYLYRDYAGAVAWAEKGALVISAIESQVGEWQFVFYYALAAAARAGHLEGEAREKLLGTARGLLEKIRQWAARCEANFGHRADLIAAEILRVSGEGDATAFEIALAKAEARGWPHDIALAHELTAAYYYCTGDAAAALRHAQRAAECYTRWGAHAKANDVRSWARAASDMASSV
jgi:serine/threonine protein kinase